MNATKPAKTGTNRHNIAMDAATRERAERLAEMDKRSVSNLIAVLLDREWERLFGTAPAFPVEQSQPQAQKEAA